jgi:D-3-phosphoglycerate dehydrogenase
LSNRPAAFERTSFGSPAHIVIPDDYPPTYARPDQVDLARLAAYGTLSLHTSRALSRAELLQRIASADVLINVRAYTLLDAEAMAAAPKLRMISILGTGTDNVDLSAATRRGIVVTNTPGATAGQPGTAPGAWYGSCTRQRPRTAAGCGRRVLHCGEGAASTGS